MLSAYSFTFFEYLSDDDDDDDDQSILYQWVTDAGWG